MSATYMKCPQTPEEWEVKAANFNSLWNFPPCIGTIDGKHILLKCPGNSGSLYFNYKGTFSIALMAMVDANLQFVVIDVGSYGRHHDGAVFANSEMGKGILDGTLNFPESKVIPEAEELGKMPYVTVADPAFQLSKHVMKPYAGRGCPDDQQIFNYRLSRARRIVENGFGILAARWRVFHTKIAVEPETAICVVKAACLLHNMVQLNTTPGQCKLMAGLANEEVSRCTDTVGYKISRRHETSY